MKPDGWSTPFDDAVPLPDGGELRTLGEARDHILALPARQQAAEAWQTAAGELLKAAETDRAWRRTSQRCRRLRRS